MERKPKLISQIKRPVSKDFPREFPLSHHERARLCQGEMLWIVSYILVSVATNMWDSGTGQGSNRHSFSFYMSQHKELKPGGGEEKENNKTGPLVSSLAEFKPELGNWKRWIQILNWTTLNFLTESV